MCKDYKRVYSGGDKKFDGKGQFLRYILYAESDLYPQALGEKEVGLTGFRIDFP
ncbi:hypothetical protein O0555_18520 [Brevibacillus laterosporus]|uniref:hypothetical protein n=1 Tax=Brevibacillus laterosporus TaxID=1465 RepID=UPI000364997E|nr:hypothetical protein [Brevibacillus laterosporus]MCR8939313.1 hypothetical protein [Brevibacillus laterosporus]MCZ0841953.1 hypothetical protein [Brevibacillus laterosporus]MCZ0845991.1 hypothetical protein [Brevibacillus laterosporus]MED1909687.1 hypothetical protein [Brevibacillus laterosporus]MED2004358.1 hypothetical protein [Brevibacillus laterosporus]